MEVIQSKYNNLVEIYSDNHDFLLLLMHILSILKMICLFGKRFFSAVFLSTTGDEAVIRKSLSAHVG